MVGVRIGPAADRLLERVNRGERDGLTHQQAVATAFAQAIELKPSDTRAEADDDEAEDDGGSARPTLQQLIESGDRSGGDTYAANLAVMAVRRA